MLAAFLAAIAIAQAQPAPTASALPRPRGSGRPHGGNGNRYTPNVYINAADYLPSPHPSSSPYHKPKNTMKSAAPKQDVFDTHQTQF
jgi:hypothetical protein